MLFKLVRSFTRLLFKKAREIGQIFKAKFIGNFRNTLIIAPQAVLCFIDQVNMDQFDGCFTRFLFQQITKVTGR